jgi:hypothetical protein
MKADIEIMSRMWNADGLTTGQIASHFSLTPGKLSGIMSRNRAKFPKRYRSASQEANDRRSAFHAVKTQAEAETAPRANCEAITKAEAIAYDAARLPMAKDLLALDSCHCRWALTADGPHMFCCVETAPLSPYCQHHKARSRGTGTKSERRAVKDAGRVAA